MKIPFVVSSEHIIYMRISEYFEAKNFKNDLIIRLKITIRNAWNTT